MKHEEQRLQEQYVAWLDSKGICFCASAGGLHTPNKRAAIRMKRAGYKAGVQDIFIYLARGGYHGMAVELKVHSYASVAQKEWQVALTQRGYYAIIVPGKLDFFAAREFLESETDKYLRGNIRKEAR